MKPIIIMDKFDKICNDIKTLKIQGAHNVAVTGVKALLLKSDPASIKKLISLRPTEPALRNAVNFARKNPKKLVPKVLKHFEDAHKKIIKIGSRKIEDGMIIFTHCHSGTVVGILEEAKKQGKNFEVHNTETRPLYQGRTTAQDLAKLKITVKHYIDSAARFALKKADLMIIGADAITTEGKVVNKIGSEMMAEVAESFGIPVYVATDSWKFDPKTLHGFVEPIEKRNPKEVWKNPPKGVDVLNPAFEKVNPDLIAGIISELGVLTPENFIKDVREKYNWGD